MKYENCEYCDGKVKEKIRDESYWYKGKMILIQNVPVGVCEACGDKYFKAPVIETMELLAKNQASIRKKIQVPVTDFPSKFN